MQAETRLLMETFQELTALTASETTGKQALLAEAFSKVQAMLQREDRGWVSVYGQNADADFGLTLDDLKDWSTKIRESVVGAPWIGQGFRLRSSYVWQNGIRYGNIPEPSRGRTNIKNFIDDPLNQFHFFGKQARKKRELCLYADGVAFWIGNDSTKAIEAIPLKQIVDQYLDPNGLGIAWAYKRKWKERDLSTGEQRDRERWYFTDRFADKRVPNITSKGGVPVEVDQNHVIFDMHPNQMEGMPYGSPDALAAYIWNAIARGAFLDGIAMVQALATFALKASSKSVGGAQNQAVQFASPQGAGSTAIMGAANDLVPMSSAGKGYDFMSLNALTAIVATSLSVSNIALTSDTANAGSSYGSAQTLELPVRLAMEARRDEHVDLDVRVLRWLGMKDVAPDVGFVPFAAGEETYRSAQSVVLGLTNDLYSRQQARDQMDDLFGRPNGDVPTEEERPSALAAKANAAAAPKPASATIPQVASPDQGQSNGTGGNDNAGKDIRRDN